MGGKTLGFSIFAIVIKLFECGKLIAVANKKLQPKPEPELRNVLLNISWIQNNYSLFFSSFPAPVPLYLLRVVLNL